MKIRPMSFLVKALPLVLLPASVWAAIVDTVNWAPDTATDGVGTGTLANGTITVDYSTISGVGNAAITIPENWDTSLATSAVAGGGVTHNTGGVLGTTPATSPQTQTITFSQDVTNVLLLVNFTDEPTSMDFGSLSLTLLDSNNAALGGSIVTFVGSVNSSNDGFAAAIAGVFGPSNPLTFTYSTTRIPNQFDSVGFTVSAQTVPEPATLALVSTGLLVSGLTGAARRRRRSA